MKLMARPELPIRCPRGLPLDLTTKKRMELLSSFLAWFATPDFKVVATVVIFAATIVAFIIGRIRSDIIALCSMALLLVTGVIGPKDALAGFSNSAVVIMLGLFVVGGAVFQTGLAKMISGKLLRLAGTSETRLFFLVMVVTATVAAFVSNTGTVALLLPIILAMSKSAGINPGKLLIPLAFASSMGGILTLIGTPPNLIVDGYLRDHGRQGFEFFDFLPIGLVCLVVGLVLLYPLCRFFLGKKAKGAEEKGDERTLASLLHEYHVSDFVFRLKATGTASPMEDKTVAELDIHRKYGVTLLEVRRENVNIFSGSIQEPVRPDTVFRRGDTIYVLGQKEHVERFAADYNLEIFEDKEVEGHAKLDFYEIGLSEVLITPESALINRHLLKANFRERFGVSVLAVKQGGKYIFDNLQDYIVRPGDMILVHGVWKGIESMAKKKREWIVIGSPAKAAEKVTLNHKAPLAAAIMVLMVLAMVFSDTIGIPPVASVIVAGLLMVLTRCIRSVDAAYKMIGWESIVLIAAMMPMSTALSVTGISEWIASELIHTLGAYGPIMAMAGVYFVTSALSTFISNSATAILVAPIAWQAAEGMGVSPTPFMMTAAVAASACFATPICTPPNAMVMNAGHYTFMDYVRVGLPLQVVMGIVALLCIPLFFPF